MKTISHFKDKLLEKNILLPAGAVFAAIGTYGISYVHTLINNSTFFNGVASLAVFGALWFLFNATQKNLAHLQNVKSRSRRILYSGLMACSFAVCYIAGWQLQAHGMLDSGFRGKGLLLFHAVLFSFAIFPFFNSIFWAAEATEGEISASARKPWKNGRIFLAVWIIIFLAWIPIFLAYYPAVMADDFHRQSQEAMKGFIWFNDYQPLAHTWLIWAALRIGEAVGSYQTGMAFFTVFQMLILSASCAYACVMIYRFVHKKWSIIVMAAIYSLLPVYSVHAVSTTKDVLFTALFQVFLCLLLERTFFSQGKKRNWIDVLWVLEGILTILFRNNALYAIAVFSIFFIIMAGKKQRLRAIILSLLLILGGKGALEGMHLVLGTDGRGSQAEMFSVPMQQLARVGNRQGEELDDETKKLLTSYIPEELWGKYNPPLADSVKISVSQYVFDKNWKNHYGELFLAWGRIGLKYPNEYIDAFLALTCGYWFWDDVSWAEVYGTGLEGRMGAISTYMSSVSEVLPNGIPHESKWPAMEQFMEEIVSANSFYNWPVISNLFRPAFWCWGLLLIVILCLYLRRKKTLLVALLPFIYFGTMLLGPVVRTRYVLPIMVSVPLLFAAWIYEGKN